LRSRCNATSWSRQARSASRESSLLSSGSPPGIFLIFIGLNRIGLGGGSWAALLCVAVGAAVAVAIKALGARLRHGPPDRSRHFDRAATPDTFRDSYAHHLAAAAS
jgi:hypothetical protein